MPLYSPRWILIAPPSVLLSLNSITTFKQECSLRDIRLRSSLRRHERQEVEDQRGKKQRTITKQRLWPWLQSRLDCVPCWPYSFAFLNCETMEWNKCCPTKTLTLSVIELSIREPRDITGERVRHVRDSAFPRDMLWYPLLSYQNNSLLNYPCTISSKKKIEIAKKAVGFWDCIRVARTF